MSAGPPLSDQAVQALLGALGGAPALTYAPPGIYPMAAPRFESAPGHERGAPPPGPLGIYAHVPFCNYKCSFCFYATELVPGPSEMERYVRALERELQAVPSGTALTQLYVGGGTPTALPAELLDRLLEAIFQRVRPGAALSTVECSPESLTVAHVRVLQQRGVGRVSMGIQSEDAAVRARIHRKHTDAHVKGALPLLVDSGFVVNVDLIYGLPTQTEGSFRHDFEAAAASGVHSVTAYNLRVNERTPVGRTLSPQERLDGPRLLRWREHVQRVAQELGFEQTRWHTFRRRQPTSAAHASLAFQDLTSWGNQFSVGISARSRLKDVIYRNVSDRATYVARIESGQSPVQEVRVLDDDERRLRYVTLTLGDGHRLERSGYRSQFSRELDTDHGEVLGRLQEIGVLSDDGEAVRLTARGRLVYDLATRAFYPERIRAWLETRQALAPA